MTPERFAGTWYHSVKDESLVDKILAGGGWQPDLVNNTIYGAAIYLARTNWYCDQAARRIIACELSLAENETMDVFDASQIDANLGNGRSSKHLRFFFQTMQVPSHKNAEKGMSDSNQARKRFFLERGIKAIMFEEYKDVDVIAVYDPSVIINVRGVLRENVEDCPVRPI